MASPLDLSRVLAAVDGSPESVEAARQAAVLAGPDGAVTLLAVYDVAPAIVGGTGTRAPDYLDEDVQKERAEKVLEGAKGALAETGAKVEAKLARGNTWDAILREVEDGGYGLVAAGSHGKGRMRGLLLGSTATELVHKAPCAVLLARESPGEFARRIVVGVDGSDNSATAHATAVALADRLGAALRVVTAQGSGADGERVEAIAGSSREDVEGDPVDALTGAASEADLLVVGSRGLKGLKALGSVSERVAHGARCSVLVVR